MSPQFRGLDKVIVSRALANSKPTNHCLWPEPYAEDSAEALVRFLTECCWTYNEANTSIELIPPHEYVSEVVRHWHECKTAGRPLIIEKSRRLILSWVLRGCELWSMGRKTEKGIITGIDFNKAAEHVWRIWWLYTQLKANRPEFNLVAPTTREGNPAAQQVGQVILPNGSMVETLNQNGLNFQGSGYAFVTMEEFSQYRNCDYMWAQAIRVTQGKPGQPGGLVAVCTNASPNKAWHAIKS